MKVQLIEKRTEVSPSVLSCTYSTWRSCRQANKLLGNFKVSKWCYVCHISHARRMARIYNIFLHLITLINIWWRVQIMEFIIIEFSPFSYSSRSFMSKYASQHNINTEKTKRRRLFVRRATDTNMYRDIYFQPLAHICSGRFISINVPQKFLGVVHYLCHLKLASFLCQNCVHDSRRGFSYTNSTLWFCLQWVIRWQWCSHLHAMFTSSVLVTPSFLRGSHGLLLFFFLHRMQV
jgi:hypothetical protein